MHKNIWQFTNNALSVSRSHPPTHVNKHAYTNKKQSQNDHIVLSGPYLKNRQITVEVWVKPTHLQIKKLRAGMCILC